MRRTNPWDFEKQMDHLISAKRPDLKKINKKRELAVPADPRVKLKESEKKDTYLDLARELKKTMEHESDGDINCNWCARYSQQSIGTGTEGFGNITTSGDHSKDSIVEIGHNTEKSPDDTTCCLSNFSEKTSANAGIKIFQMSKIMTNQRLFVDIYVYKLIVGVDWLTNLTAYQLI